MKGQKLIKKINKGLLAAARDDYQKLLMKEKMISNLKSIAEISSKLLLIAGVASAVIILGAIAPNIIGVIGKMVNKEKRKFYFKCDEKKFNQTLVHLKSRHFIKIEPDKDTTYLKLTKKGERRHNLFILENLKIPKMKRWDGRWRMVIFDISEKFKNAREALRLKLKDMGFYQVQKSVLIFPYPCEKEINFIKQIFDLNNQVKIVLVDSFQGEEEIRQHFNL
ncbi:MAG: phenylacetic acid degradation operon negative regulatory protein [Parcubacteria group bacterium LiPW_39]|nr:MAG: phenylacetic acid degradation operon negative regulatory protein [Parcubacteria group bacterium LiPW_39]